MTHAIDVAHAAYALDCHDADWLEQLVSLMAPLLDKGRGIVGFRWRRQPDDSVHGSRFVMAGERDGDPEMLRELLATLDPTRTSMAYYAPYSFQSLSSIAQHHPVFHDITQDPDMQRVAHGRDLVDFEMLRVDQAHNMGWMFSVLHSEVTQIPTARRELWARIAAHIAAGARLRLKLSGVDLNEAAAIFDVHAESWEVQDRDLANTSRIDHLRHHIEARNTARALAADSPLEAMNLWEGLVDGQWSLLDVVDTDGRTFTVLHKNPIEVGSRVALSERERQVAWLTGRGHHVKLVAYELGVSASTVRTQLRSALRKLNVEDIAGLHRLIDSVERPEDISSLDDLRLLALAQAPPSLPDALTEAEAEVALLVYEGLSNREIALERGTSERTAANQLTAIYRKLDIASRHELVQCLQARG